MNSSRDVNEIRHGKFLAEKGAEDLWGWGSPAGTIRAHRRAQLIAQGASLQPGVRVLEVGCGTGNFTEKFALTGASIVAVDISEHLLALAKQRRLPCERIRFLNKPFEKCDVDAPFDAVIGSSILHHLDIDLALPKMFDLLRPGGRFCFAEPNMLNPQIFLQKNIPWLKKMMGDSPDETAFCRWSIAAQLCDIGFVSVRLTPFDWLHPATPRPLIRPLSFAGGHIEKVPLLREFAGSLLIKAAKPN